MGSPVKTSWTPIGDERGFTGYLALPPAGSRGRVSR